MANKIITNCKLVAVSMFYFAGEQTYCLLSVRAEPEKLESRGNKK
jgi:hypothetical protein